MRSIRNVSHFHATFTIACSTIEEMLHSMNAGLANRYLIVLIGMVARANTTVRMWTCLHLLVFTTWDAMEMLMTSGAGPIQRRTKNMPSLVAMMVLHLWMLQMLPSQLFSDSCPLTPRVAPGEISRYTQHNTLNTS